MLTALVVAPASHAQSETTELMPGVSYTRDVRTIDGKQVVEHVIVAPKPGGLYGLKPVLLDRTVVGRQTLTDIQRASRGRPPSPA